MASIAGGHAGCHALVDAAADLQRLQPHRHAPTSRLPFRCHAGSLGDVRLRHRAATINVAQVGSGAYVSIGGGGGSSSGDGNYAGGTGGVASSGDDVIYIMTGSTR